MEYSVTAIDKESFPSLLLEIPDAPDSLYIRGQLPDPEAKLLVVVGSRKYSQYGKDVTTKLLSGLSGQKVGIVSGLALGIDGLAHRTALENGLKTFAVLGSGLNDDAIHPHTHRDLSKEILENGGGLISEEKPEKKAAPYMFPKRNRIVAGMSHAVLIIEAAEKSGTLITARLAMDYNRDVLTVPGSIYSANSFGPNYLIKNGATPVTSCEDLLGALGLESGQKTLDLVLNQKEKLIYEKTKFPVERVVLEEELDLPISELNVILSALEIKGILRERMGKIEHV